MNRAATFQPSSFNVADNTIEVIWSVGAEGSRLDWLDGDYYTESLSMDPAHVRLGRLNAGACLIDSHQDRSLGAVLGSVVPGTARIENGQGIARVRLAKTPDVADTVAKIIDGHIRSVSVGYNVHTYQRAETPGERTVMHAIDWEPVELSMVVVPFDPAAQVRSEGTHMPDIIETDEPNTRNSRSAVTADYIRQRCSRSDNISRELERRLLAEHAEEPLSRRELERAIGDALIEHQALPLIDSRQGRGGAGGDIRQLRDNFTDALFARMSGTEPTEGAREYRDASVVDMARALLERNGEPVRFASRQAVVNQVLRYGSHTAGDFATLIGNAGTRVLAEARRALPSPLLAIARNRNYTDFRTRYNLNVDGPAGMINVPENGEFQQVHLIEGSNGSKLSTYGGIMNITRQALVNDDLGVFLQLSQFWVNAATETQSALMSGMIAGNGAVMTSDNKTLYHADHGNIAVAGTLNVANLSIARALLRTQKNPDGSTPANAVPKHLVVGPALETIAEQVLAVVDAGTVADVNPFSGKLTLSIDPYQTGLSWRLFSDPATRAVLEYGDLEGQGGIFTDTRIGFEVDGVQFKARIDIGAGLVDYRGTVMNPGAST
ncbi:prohead protease/major capsid protein fusion protein [Sphingomonas aurantiaca]|nr:prohead protease/major capsid protein fusion protein [Sphingomonas aurantiaca]